MGMDCVAVNPKSSEYRSASANWSGWSYLMDLISQLGVSMDGVTGSNDGDLVKAGVAKKMGFALEGALKGGAVLEIETEDKSYSGGYKTTPIVSSIAQDEKVIREIVARKGVLHPVNERTKAWLRGWAEFLINCGGFRQC